MTFNCDLTERVQDACEQELKTTDNEQLCGNSSNLPHMKILPCDQPEKSSLVTMRSCTQNKGFQFYGPLSFNGLKIAVSGVCINIFMVK